MLRVRAGVVSALLSAALFVSPASALTAFSDFYAFGDGLVDVGNLSFLAGGPGVVPERLSNGLILSDYVNIAIEGVPIDNSIDGGDSFGFIQGTARSTGSDSIPDLPQQLNLFLTANPTVNTSALYVIDVGMHDALQAFQVAAAAGDPTPIINGAVSAIASFTGALAAFGVPSSHIVVMGIQDIGGTPALAGSGGEAAARGLTQSINSAIQGATASTATYFDTMGLMDAIIADPTAFGLPAGISFSVACLDNPAQLPGCSDHAFFDSVHHTTAIAGIIAGGVIAAVPEPGTALLLGLGLVGLASRRRRTA